MIKIISTSHSTTGYPEITKCKIQVDGCIEKGKMYCVCNNMLNGDLETSNVYAIGLDTMEYDETGDNLVRCVIITEDMLLECDFGEFKGEVTLFPGSTFFLTASSSHTPGLSPSQEGHFMATDVFNDNGRLIIRFKKIY